MWYNNCNNYNNNSNNSSEPEIGHVTDTDTKTYHNVRGCGLSVFSTRGVILCRTKYSQKQNHKTTPENDERDDEGGGLVGRCSEC